MQWIMNKCYNNWKTTINARNSSKDLWCSIKTVMGDECSSPSGTYFMLMTLWRSFKRKSRTLDVLQLGILLHIHQSAIVLSFPFIQFSDWNRAGQDYSHSCIETMKSWSMPDLAFKRMCQPVTIFNLFTGCWWVSFQFQGKLHHTAAKKTGIGCINHVNQLISNLSLSKLL